MKAQYLDKRDGNSRLLLFKAYELNYKIVKEATEILIKEDFFNHGEIISNKKLVKVYFEKLLFYDFLHLSHQITIIEHDKIYNKNVLYTSVFICEELLNKALSNLGYKYRIRNKIELKIKQFCKNKFIYFIEKVIKKINCKLIDKKKIGLDNDDANIGINYSEGIDNNKRSDLFFLEKSDIPKKNIILYFEYPNIKKKHSSLEKLENLIQKNEIKFVDLWKWKQNKIFYDISLIKRKKKNSIEEWVFNEIIKLIRQINFWQNFFLDYNLKIHLDPSEFGNSTIVKQIALENLNSISIGKQRSYPSDIEYAFLHFYPNDVFFVWGEDSYNKLKKSIDYTKQFLLSGYPYPINKNYNKTFIKTNLNDKVKFKILLLDNGHDLNKGKGAEQLIYTPDLCNFYNKFFTLAANDPEIGLIIKSKRYSEFTKLKDIQKKAKQLVDQKKCIIIKDSYQVAPIDVGQEADLSVGIGIWPPSAFMESLLSCKGMYFDYSNVFHNDIFFNQGKNSIIFSNLEVLVTKLVNYKKHNFVDRNYANWSKFSYKIDYFRDTSGHIRIGEFISNIKKNLDKNLTPLESIKDATYNYKKKWYKNNNYNLNV